MRHPKLDEFESWIISADLHERYEKFYERIQDMIDCGVHPRVARVHAARLLCLLSEK
ncbi:hypothetical protein [Thermoactinomyces sp. DSM 45892]|uniref:hypothetical protein n=1 Tax=Thermoactinomyces sp. DSM 45892 TaxID=1882753 RepID=UPI0008943B63|nr:hypothetical protein [Thermoactinomyces sp. DSM 45892]SDY89013.1 hypothetical protein SAMN05444416_109183 [Thermoactinomyces sp. DSM 45892]